MHILIILIISALIVFAIPRLVKAVDLREGLTIQKYDDDFTLQYYNYKKNLLFYFEEKGLQGGGPTWAALVKAGLELDKSPHLESVHFDEEGDMLYLYSPDKKAVYAVKKIIELLNKNVAFREKCIAQASAEGYLE